MVNVRLMNNLARQRESWTDQQEQRHRGVKGHGKGSQQEHCVGESGGTCAQKGRERGFSGALIPCAKVWDQTGLGTDAVRLVVTPAAPERDWKLGTLSD